MSSDGAYSRDKSSKLGGSWEVETLKSLGYKKGMILRIKMVNFLTYDDCEVFPGPKLNVILGPNGTGKSTIMHAVCLVCAGRTDTIGRSDNVQQFVKNGKGGSEEGTYIEIDMLCKGAGGDYGKTVRVKRFIQHQHIKHTWEIDGKKKTLPEVKKLMVSMNVDVDNLCTFMAQDKVGDFTTQTNRGMLQKTLQCIEALDEDQEPMGKTLAEVQLELNDIELSKKAKAREVDAKRHAHEDVTMQLETMRAEVDRMQRRDATKKLREKYEIKLAVVKSTELRARFTELQKAVNEAQKALQETEQKILPLEERERELSQKLIMKDKENSRTSKTITEIDTIVEKNKVNIRNTMERLSEISGDLDNIITVRKGKEKKLKDLKESKRKIDEQLKNLEPQIPALKEEVRSIDPKRNSLREGKDNLDDEKDELNKTKRALEHEQKRIEREYQDCSDPKSIYYDKLSSMPDMRDEAACMRWVQNNGDKFEKEVIGPLGLHIKVEDPEAQLLVNQSINRNLMNSFIVQTERDMETFRSIPSTDKKLKRNRARVAIVPHVDLSTWNNLGSGYSKSDLDSFNQQFGFKGFLKDYIECPDLIKCSLSAQIRPSLETLYARASSKDVITKQHMHAICPGGGKDPHRASLFVVVTTTPKKNGIHDTYKYSMSFSQHNKRQEQTSSSSFVNFTENFLGGALDEEGDEKSAAELEDRKRKNEAELMTCAKRIAEISKEAFAKDKEINYLNNQREVLRKKIAFPADIQKKLPNILKAINVLTKALNEGEQRERVKLEKDYMAATSETLDKMDVIYEHSRNAINLHLDVVIEQEMRQICEDELRDARDSLDEAKRGLDDYKARKQAAVEAQSEKKAEMDEALEELKRIQGTFESASRFVKYYKEEVHTDEYCPENTVAEIEIRIEELERAITSIADNAGVLVQYEAKRAEEEKLRKALQTLELELENSAAKVEDQSKSWFQQVTRIISRVNTKFEEYMKKLQFAGEVKFSDKGTFSEYELQLHVAFKENQSVQLLDGHKHSGGERAVSTIMYLMALQNLISAPFRSVDEINQGMDERNERLVFDRIVSSCTGESVDSQYFLVSPKLLQGLRSMDHSDVTVLMIWNGPGVRNKWQISNMIKQIKKRKRRNISDITNLEEGSNTGFEDEVGVGAIGKGRRL